jgi:Na+/H+-dicarboxylate symporter
MAENQVPAVVLFSVLCGIAIIGMTSKQSILNTLDVMQGVLGRVTGFIVSLSPLGVFCIVAAAAGSMDLAEIARIQGYMVLMSVIVFAFCFLLVPALVTLLTPFKAKDISPLLWASFILAFATGKTLVVLPMLIEGIREIFEKHEAETGADREGVNSIIEVLVPLSYSFPHLGRIMATSFIPFAGWYIGQPLSLEMYPVIFGAGLFVHFSTAPVSIPFLLDLARLPSDLFQLFLVVGIYMGRLSDAIGATYILAVTLLGTCAVNGMLRFQARRLAGLTAVVAVVSLALVIGGRYYLNLTSTEEYIKDKVVAAMQLPRNTVETSLVQPAPNPVPLAEGQSRLDRIRKQRLLRVGLSTDHLPFAYFNQAGEPAGFDLEIISALAKELGVRLELVPISVRSEFLAGLENDYYDIAIGGFPNTVELSQRTPFSVPYLELHSAMVVRDHRQKEFESIEDIQTSTGLRLAIIAGGGFEKRARLKFPDADIVTIDSPREFFTRDESGDDRLDLLYISAEAGSAWTLLYPEFQVITPFDQTSRLPIVIPYAGESDPSLDEFLDNWIMLKKSDGTLQRAYDYWILGQGADPGKPGWSVIRNVLGWVD